MKWKLILNWSCYLKFYSCLTDFRYKLIKFHICHFPQHCLLPCRKMKTNLSSIFDELSLPIIHFYSCYAHIIIFKTIRAISNIWWNPTFLCKKLYYLTMLNIVMTNKQYAINLEKYFQAHYSMVPHMLLDVLYCQKY